MISATRRVDVVAWADTSSLIRVQLAELVALETVRTYHVADTTVTIRRGSMSKKTADTLVAASSALRSEVSAEDVKTRHTRPLTAESKKKGLAWRRTLVLVGCVIIFVIFAAFYCNVKKK